jgi:hypothetical protein
VELGQQQELNVRDGPPDSSGPFRKQCHGPFRVACHRTALQGRD